MEVLKYKADGEWKSIPAIRGEAATVKIGTVTTLDAGSEATVDNVGTDTDAILNFGIPKGDPGEGGGGGGGIIEETDPTVPTHVKNITEEDLSNWNNKSEFSGSYNDLTDKPTIPTVPTDISAFNNDSGYLTEIPSGYATEDYVNNATKNMVTSYNDLTDIPCGTILEITKTIVPKDTYNSGQAYIPDSYEFLTEGAEYTVIYNGITYKCISEWKMLTDGKEGLGFGNDSLYSDNGTDTGESFSIIADDWDECFRINFKDADQGEIELHLGNITIKQIDPKYIPSEYVTEEELNNATSNIITSYNDLEDKPFGEETTPYNCIPEDTVITNGNSYYREEGFIGIGGLGADLKYLVNFNGTEYLCETIGVYEYENYIGNPHYLDESLESNEYPFCILADSYSEVYRIYFDGDADTTAVISLYELVTNTKQIDSKYIPAKYVTEEELDEKGYLTEVPSGYATEDFVTNAITEAIRAALEANY